jgi:hypothetical protein
MMFVSTRGADKPNNRGELFADSLVALLVSAGVEVRLKVIYSSTAIHHTADPRYCLAGARLAAPAQSALGLVQATVGV